MTSGLRRSLFLTLCMLTAPSLAATLIESRDGAGDLTQMWIENGTARLQQPNKEGYMLLDLQSGRMYGIDDARKVALEIEFDGKGVAETGQSVKAALQEQGVGPKIAGYPTRHYRLTADGEDCGAFYLSKKALDNEDIRSMADGFRNLRTNVADSNDVCERAEHYAVTQFPKLGIPLRQADADGVQHEIVRIEEHAKAPVSFTIPSDYQRINMKQAMEQMMRQHQNMPR